MSSHKSHYMPRFEIQSHERAFDFFREKAGVSVDWVKLQVYGKISVPEEFPTGVSSLQTILESAQPASSASTKQVPPGK